MKRFPVAWMAGVLALLTSADAVALLLHGLPPAAASWVGLGITLLTLILGKITHNKVTPLADPRTDNGRPLVPAVK